MATVAECNCHGPILMQASLGDVDRGGLSSGGDREPTALIDVGDTQSRNQRVKANLGLVATIARQFLGRGLDLDDLIGEGNLGLIRAAERFDSNSCTHFSTYAAYWIKEAIYCALLNTTATIRVPAYMTRLKTKWRRAERILFQKAGRAPTFDAIATSLKLTEVQKCLVHQAFRVGQVKLETNYSVESGNTLEAEVSDRRPRSEDRLELEEDWLGVVRRMERLDSRERVVLTLRFGLEGELLTAAEIGRRLRITGQWVRSIEFRALRKLSENVGRNRLPDISRVELLNCGNEIPRDADLERVSKAEGRHPHTGTEGRHPHTVEGTHPHAAHTPEGRHPHTAAGRHPHTADRKAEGRHPHAAGRKADTQRPEGRHQTGRQTPTTGRQTPT